MDNSNQPGLARLLGICLLLTALFGMFLSMAGVFYIWTARDRLTNRILDNLEISLSIMKTTDDGLVVIGDSLGNLSEIVNTLETSLETFGTSVRDARPMVTEIRSIIGNEIPAALAATKTSVESAQASAEIVDTVLRTITSIPFFPGEAYEPEVPLNVALGRVAVTLGELPESLAETESGLGDLSQNLQLTRVSLELLAADIGAMEEQLDDAELVIISYQRILDDLIQKTETTIENVPAWVNTATALLTAILVWMFFTQVGLLYQASILLGFVSNGQGKPAEQASSPEPSEPGGS